MKLYEEVLLEDNVLNMLDLKSWIKGLIALCKVQWHISIKITIFILLGLGLSSILYSIYLDLKKEEECDDIKDEDRKSVCKKTRQLSTIQKMINGIDLGIKKLNPNNKDDAKKIDHLKKQRSTLIKSRNEIELDYRVKLEKLNSKVL